MAGALDINDMDWGGEGLGVMSGTIDVLTVSPVKTPKHATVDLAASPVVSAPATGFTRNGTAPVVAPAVTPALTRTAALNRAAAAKPPPPLFAGSSAGRTRGSRNQRTSPFNLKACSACKKDRASAIKCRVDSRHWEDPDWTDPPTRAWAMPPGFVEWLAKSESGAGGQQQPGKSTAAAAAAAIRAKNQSRAVASSSFKYQGPRRVPGPETASSLLDRMLGSAALPPRAPAPVVPSVVPAPRVAPGGPLAGGGGIKRPRCLAPGCMNAVARDAPFCSDDCVVTAQRQAVQALVSSRGQLRASRAPLPPRASAARGASRSGAGTVAGGAAAAVASTTNNGSAGGDAATVGDGGAGGTGAGGGGGSTVGAAGASASSASAPGAWTPQDEEQFAKGLEAVRGRSTQNSTQRFRNKVMDRFRELFAEGMNELGVDSMDVAVFSGVLAWDLEHELNAFSRSDRGVYKEKAQSLRFNIKFAKNPELFKVRNCCSTAQQHRPVRRVAVQC